MTESLMPLLEKAAPYSRVITVSSGGMYSAPLTNDLQVKELRVIYCIACIYYQLKPNQFIDTV